MKCDPKDNNWNCCTDTTPCGIGEGDCDNDSHCAGDLICGKNDDFSNNCPAGHKDMDCCIAPQRCEPKDNKWSCCTDTNPCGIGEGDCDKDSHCAGNLICGTKEDNSNNCPAGFWNMDCCIAPLPTGDCTNAHEA